MQREHDVENFGSRIDCLVGHRNRLGKIGIAKGGKRFAALEKIDTAGVSRGFVEAVNLLNQSRDVFEAGPTLTST